MRWLMVSGARFLVRESRSCVLRPAPPVYRKLPAPCALRPGPVVSGPGPCALRPGAGAGGARSSMPGHRAEKSPAGVGPGSECGR